MTKKLLLVLFTAVFLSGCTLLPKTENAATDTKSASPLPSPSAIPTPPLEPDDTNKISTYENTQKTSVGTDMDSLEKDLNSTNIPDENLNDILTK